MSDPPFRKGRAAVRTSRNAGAAAVLSQETRHQQGVAAHHACETAGISIAEIRVKLWYQERRQLMLELTSRFIRPDTDEIPPA